MKILMLGWELPPNNSGGLGVASYQLCKALANHGADIEFILPCGPIEKAPFMKVTTLFPDSTAAWFSILEAYRSDLYGEQASHHLYGDLIAHERLYADGVARFVFGKQYDVIHAHDWLTFRA